MTTEKAAPKKAAPKKEESKIYIGPNTKTIQRYTVFKDELPSFINKQIEACAALGKLFVPISELNQAQTRLSDQTSAESIFYAEAKKYFEGVK